MPTDAPGCADGGTSAARSAYALDRAVEKRRRQPQKDHAVERFERAHELPMRREVQIYVAVGGHRFKRIEHCRFGVRQRPEQPVGSSPDRRFDRAQQGRQQRGDAHHHTERQQQMALTFPGSDRVEQLGVEKAEANDVEDDAQRDQRKAPRPVTVPTQCTVHDLSLAPSLRAPSLCHGAVQGKRLRRSAGEPSEAMIVAGIAIVAPARPCGNVGAVHSTVSIPTDSAGGPTHPGLSFYPACAAWGAPGGRLMG
jgi:hypothetical protein